MLALAIWRTMDDKDNKPIKDELGTETTFADMNLEGFSWYDPTKKGKSKNKNSMPKITRKEYWSMVKGAFLAYLPFFLVVIASFGIMVLIAYLWLGF